MPRGQKPEEFFEVFREVLESKKKQDDAPAAHEKAPEPEKGRESLRQSLADRANALLSGTVTVSNTVLAASVVGVVLLLLAAYLLGRQAGWSRCAAALQRAPAPGAGPEAGPAGGEAAPAAVEPELIDGRILVLLTSGKQEAHREGVAKEAQYLNAECQAFKALGVRAYVYRDGAGSYRLCARGLAGLSGPELDRVVKQIQRIKSSRGKPDFADAGFQRP